MEERAGETANDCAKKCCRIFTDLIGVPTTEEDLEAEHRDRDDHDGQEASYHHPLPVQETKGQSACQSKEAEG